MTTIVGIFDEPEQVEDATKRLAAAELDAVVLDETTLGQEPGSLDPVYPALVPGAAAEVVAGRVEPNLLPKRDKQSLIRAFRERLAEDYSLPDDVTAAYATTFTHGGTFVVVCADKDDSERAIQMLRDAGASGVNKHD